MENKVNLKFYKRDFLFDNGIVNLSLEIEKLSETGQINIDLFKIQLTPSYLEIEGKLDNLDELYKKIYIEISKKIIHWTNNDKYYWDEVNKKIIVKKRFDLTGRSSGNDIKRITNKNKKNLVELNISKEYLINELYNIFPLDQFENIPPQNKSATEKQQIAIKKSLEDFCSLSSIEAIENEKKDIELLIYKNLNELSEVELNITIENKKSNTTPCFICPEDKAYLQFDTNVHMFDASFGNQPIGKWSYLIYRSGARTNRYFYEAVRKSYFYLHSYSLKELFDIKKKISINNNKIKWKKKDSELTGIGNNNFHMIEDVNGKYTEYNFKVYGQYDTILKLLVGLYKQATDQSKQVEKSIDNKSGDYDLDIFRNASIVTFSDKGITKDNITFYNKLSQLFRVFEKLDNIFIKTSRIDKLSLFDLLFKIKSIPSTNSNSNLITMFSEAATVNAKDWDKPSLQEFVNRFLNLQPLHNLYFIFQFNLLTMEEKDKNGKGNILPEYLSNFEQTYLELTKGDNSPEALLHQLCYNVGKEIGRFLGSTKNKDLIFTLRAVNNREQLVQFIRDFRFKHIKETSDEANFHFKGEFNDSLDALLNIIANNKRIEMIRDYLALYCISGYSIGSYHKDKSEQNN